MDLPFEIVVCYTEVDYSTLGYVVEEVVAVGVRHLTRLRRNLSQHLLHHLSEVTWPK